MRLLVWTRQRSRWLGYEWHNHGATRYIHISLGHPDRHAWWAFSGTLYLTGMRGSRLRSGWMN